MGSPWLAAATVGAFAVMFEPHYLAAWDESLIWRNISSMRQV
jgi:hypothetical protein